MPKNPTIELGMMVNVQIDGRKIRLLVVRTNAPEGQGYYGLDVRTSLGKQTLANMSNGTWLAANAEQARRERILFQDTNIMR